MEEFLKNNYSLITRIFEIFPAVVGLLLYRKYRNSYAKYFIWFLVAIVFIEIIGGYPRRFIDLGLYHLIDDTLFERNYWWFTLFWTIGGALFYSWYFQKILEIKSYARILHILRFVFLVFSLVYIGFNFNDFFISSLKPIRIAGAALIVLACIMYFLEVLMSPKILEFFKLLDFYIASTLFIWFLITTSVVFYELYFLNVDWSFIILRYQILLFSNVFMYSIFTFALLWCKKSNS